MICIYKSTRIGVSYITNRMSLVTDGQDVQLAVQAAVKLALDVAVARLERVRGDVASEASFDPDGSVYTDESFDPDGSVYTNESFDADGSVYTNESFDAEGLYVSSDFGEQDLSGF